MKKLISLLFVLCFLIFACSPGFWQELADPVCSGFTDCLHGTTRYSSYIDWSCHCDCDDDWCGTRCNVQISKCNGTIVETTFTDSDFNSFKSCHCKCPSLFVNPPLCNAVHVGIIFLGGKNSNNTGDAISKNAVNDYFPLQLNNYWKFDVFDEYQVKDGEIGFRIEEVFEFDSVTYYDMHILYPDTTNNMISDTNAMPGPLLFNNPSNPLEILQYKADSMFVQWFYHQYTIGDTILINGTEGYVGLAGTITVPAGQFDNCISVLDSTGTGQIFAPNVGWIANLTEFDTTIVLTDYNRAGKLTADIEVSPVTCHGGNDGAINLSFNGDTTGVSLLWTGPEGTYTDGSPDNLVAGLYSLLLTSPEGEAIIDSIPIFEPDSFYIELRSVIHTDCQNPLGGAIEIAAFGGQGPMEYLWNNGEWDTQNLNNLAAGCYELIAIDSVGCMAELKVEILAPDIIEVEAALQDVTCADAQDGAIILTISGGQDPYSIEWNTGAISSSLSGLNEGEYSVVITDANNCATERSFEVFEPDTLSVLVGPLEDISCFDGADGLIQVEAMGGTAPYTYDWNDGEMTGGTLSNLGAGIYELLVSDDNMCTIDLIVELHAPDAVITELDTFQDVTCAGDADGSLSIKVSGGVAPYRYQWDNFETTMNIAGLSGGNYKVTVFDSHDCLSFFSHDISEPDPLATEVLQLEDVSCNGLNDGSVSLDILGGMAPYSVNWSNGAADLINGDLGAGTYDLEILDSNNCSYSESFTIRQPDSIAYRQLEIEEVLCKGDNTASISLELVGGTPPFSLNWNNGLSDESQLTDIAAGTYILEVSDAHDCSAQFMFVVEEPEALNLSFNVMEDIDGQSNGAAEVMVTGGVAPYTYLWNDMNGQTTAEASGLSAGIYSITVTDANGCVHSAFVEVPMITATEDIEENKLLIYPNPSTGHIRLSVSGAIDGNKSELFVLDLSGQQVYTHDALSNDHFVELDLVPGVYIICLKTKGKGMLFERIIVQ